eukprot:TRINITY_DN8289_c0_g1_i1.p1 TRINITY_DN8289_c0_g1~~TRINITY_DN8289_c0_g1_i1.p1  ORF type:complete len:219 (+),score=31.13 TRINITY_DN8289_c0_g1_i1:87-659(+)
MIKILSEQIVRFEDIETAMFFINSLHDLAENNHVIRSVIELKKLLSHIALGSAAYLEPAQLKHPINPSKELASLFDFFRQMHVAIWEIRIKLRIILSAVHNIQTSDKAVILSRTIKAIKTILEPISEELRIKFSVSEIPGEADIEVTSLHTLEKKTVIDPLRWVVVSKRQDRILNDLNFIQSRIELLEQM